MARETREPRFRGEALEKHSRALRWCTLQTQRAARQAACRGHPISRTNQNRMTQRRWSAWLSRQHPHDIQLLEKPQPPQREAGSVE